MNKVLFQTTKLLIQSDYNFSICSKSMGCRGGAPEIRLPSARPGFTGSGGEGVIRGFAP